MAMFLILNSLIFPLVISQGLWCSSSNCSSCTQGFLYLSHKCLATCPTGYPEINKTCSTPTSLILFSFTSGIPLPFNAASIGPFIHPQGLEFRDQGKKSPIMTKERGLYFSKTSVLISNTSWILAPDFRLHISFRLISPGVIFEATSGVNKFFEFFGNITSLTAGINYYVNGVNKTEYITTSYTAGSWIVIIIDNTIINKIIIINLIS